MINLINLPVDPIEVAEETPFLAQYFPGIFAEALVPLNPRRWLAFAAGSAAASDMPEFGDKIQTPFNNLVVAKEYLETSKSDVQWRDRIWQVAQDTFTINGSCEIGDDVGSFGAGAAANKIADGYMDEMVETSFTLKKSEKLNERIYQQFAGERGLDTSLVRGTGLGRQFVPVASRGNILDRPTRGARPLWAKKPYSKVIQSRGRGPLGFITPLIFNKRSALQLAKVLLSKNSYSIIKKTFIIYCYFRYIRFICKIGKNIGPKLYKVIKNKFTSIRTKRKKPKYVEVIII